MAKSSKKKTSVIVQNFGLFWKRKYINWDKEQIIGREANRKSRGDAVNFWGQKGIYVLYKEFEPIYVGQVGLKMEGGNHLGPRLAKHADNIDMGEKWDTFSWFGVRPITTKAAPTYPKGFHKRYNAECTGYQSPRQLLAAKGSFVTPDGLVTLLEAVIISLFGGSIQNKQDGGWRNIKIRRYHQDQDSSPALYALRQNDPLDAGILADIRDKGDRLDKALKEIQGNEAELTDKLLNADKLEENLMRRTIDGLQIKGKGKPKSKLFGELNEIKRKMPSKKDGSKRRARRIQP
jgi:hypothetical protein